jgi:hypothetical protein
MGAFLCPRGQRTSCCQIRCLSTSRTPKTIFASCGVWSAHVAFCCSRRMATGCTTPPRSTTGAGLVLVFAEFFRRPASMSWKPGASSVERPLASSLFTTDLPTGCPLGLGHSWRPSSLPLCVWPTGWTEVTAPMMRACSSSQHSRHRYTTPERRAVPSRFPSVAAVGAPSQPASKHSPTALPLRAGPGCNHLSPRLPRDATEWVVARPRTSRGGPVWPVPASARVGVSECAEGVPSPHQGHGNARLGGLLPLPLPASTGDDDLGATDPGDRASPVTSTSFRPGTPADVAVQSRSGSSPLRPWPNLSALEAFGAPQ